VTATASAPPTLRQGTPDDARACLELLWASATDLGRRRGTTLEGSADDWWANSEPLYRFLAEHAAEWWVAEDPGSPGRLIGYARSVERGGLLELTEFFVVPGEQSRGVGRALLDRAFPLGRGEVRSIIATTDVRALARYYRADTIARFPYFTVAGPPSADDAHSRLSSEPLEDAAASLTAVADVERAVLGYPRGEAEIRWLLQARDGWVYRDEGAVVGFAFVGKAGAGPIAAFEPRHLPDILLHVEGRAAADGIEKLELEVPAPNATAIRHLLGRGFRIDPWINLLMSNRSFGQFDRFVGYSPPIIL
jgi:GNAT superfamily N-acetyltransferase